MEGIAEATMVPNETSSRHCKQWRAQWYCTNECRKGFRTTENHKNTVSIESYLQVDRLSTQYSCMHSKALPKRHVLEWRRCRRQLLSEGPKKSQWQNLGAQTSTWHRLLDNESDARSFTLNDRDKMKQSHFYYPTLKEHYEKERDLARWIVFLWWWVAARTLLLCSA